MFLGHKYPKISLGVMHECCTLKFNEVVVFTSYLRERVKRVPLLTQWCLIFTRCSDPLHRVLRIIHYIKIYVCMWSLSLCSVSKSDYVGNFYLRGYDTSVDLLLNTILKFTFCVWCFKMVLIQIPRHFTTCSYRIQPLFFLLF